ncbi:MAG: exostosin family protein [Leptothrix sp. (in: b-proteobacteria)]
MNWLRQGSVVAWPYGWQRPNKTEEWAYEQCLAVPKPNRFVQFVCFPWATLIDLLRNGKNQKAQPYLDALHWAPPKTTLKRVTVMQHIWAKDMLPWLAKLGITDLYWAHATNEETSLEGIRIHPFPLYPVCSGVGADPATSLPAAQRSYLYSFIGAYTPRLYLTPVRQWIFDLPARPDACVERRDQWHYQDQVYRQQIEGDAETEQSVNVRRMHEHEYQRVLSQSIFSLCPSGSGPNSIRLWESLGMGCIPVVLADTLRLMGHDATLWNAAAIMLPETTAAVKQLPALLGQLAADSDRLAEKRAAARVLWCKYVQGNAHIGDYC